MQLEKAYSQQAVGVFQIHFLHDCPHKTDTISFLTLSGAVILSMHMDSYYIYMNNNPQKLETYYNIKKSIIYIK